jgi:hypothetical protein
MVLTQLGRRGQSRPRLSMFLLPIFLLAAAMISPYGITNLTHPYEVSFGPAAEHWRVVSEWVPPYARDALRDPGVRAFWALLLVAIATLLGALLRRRQMTGTLKHLPVAAVALLTLSLAATSRRFVPFLAVASLPPLAMVWSRILPAHRLPAAAWIIATILAATTAGADIADRLFVSRAIWPRSQGWAARLVRADEQPADAVRFVLTSTARGRLFTGWTWGGYLLYSVPFENEEPRYKIYIDGRAQAAYPAQISEDFIAMYGAAAESKRDMVSGFLDHYRIDVCVLGRERKGPGTIVPELADWVAVYGDDRAVVAVRREAEGSFVSGTFPDEAIAQASAALHLRSRGEMTVEEMLGAFQHALSSVRSRPTTTGVTEMVRIALGARGTLGESMRAQATTECDRLLQGGIPADVLYEASAIAANTAQCRAALAETAGDKETARRMRARALAELARSKQLFRRALR